MTTVRPFISTVLLVILNLHLTAQEAKPVKKLRVMSYNIFNGFDWGKAITRKDSMTTWIREQSPDVVAFQELCNFNTQKLKEWAGSFGHDHSVILKEDGYPVGISSRYPILVKGIFPGGKLRGFLHVQTGGVEFIVVHLNPSDVNIRRQEFKMVRDYILSVSADTSIHLMVLGDFNSHSPFDAAYDRKFPGMLKRMRNTEASRPGVPGNLVEGQFDYSVMSGFLSIPLVDVVEPLVADDLKRTFPTPILTGSYYTELEMKECGERIDFILASPKLGARCTKAFIFNRGMPDLLSDHYPIIAEFIF